MVLSLMQVSCSRCTTSPAAAVHLAGIGARFQTTRAFTHSHTRTEIEIATWPFWCDGGMPGGPGESLAIISLDMSPTSTGTFDVAPDAGSRAGTLSSDVAGIWSVNEGWRGQVRVLRNTETSLDALLDLHAVDGGRLEGALHVPKCPP